MDRFDRKLRRTAKREMPEVPDYVLEATQRTLAALPDKDTDRKLVNYPSSPWLTAAKVFAVLAVIFLVVPNVSTNIARAMEQIPVIGDIVRVVTIRNYTYHDDYHGLDAEVPSVEIDGTDNAAASSINEDVTALTDAVIERFYNDMDMIGEQGHTYLSIDYEVLSNSADWFTLKLTVYDGAGSGNTYYKFYHVDKRSGQIVQLSDMFKQDSGYQSAISQEIQRQMQERMDENENVVYWLDSDYPEWNFTSIDDDQNFYFSENGTLVIVFDKYEVAPGSMGCPEFEIPFSVYSECLLDTFADVDTVSG